MLCVKWISYTLFLKCWFSFQIIVLCVVRDFHTNQPHFPASSLVSLWISSVILSGGLKWISGTWVMMMGTFWHICSLMVRLHELNMHLSKTRIHLAAASCYLVCGSFLKKDVVSGFLRPSSLMSTHIWAQIHAVPSWLESRCVLQHQASHAQNHAT